MTSVNITLAKYKTINLPSFPEAKIEINQSLTVKEIEDIRESVKIEPSEEDNFNKAVGEAMILKAIKSWNLADGEKDLEISIENLKKLPFVDYQFILQNVTGDKLVDENGELLSAKEVDTERKKK